MEAGHLGSGNRICTVVFVDIVRYGEELVSKQVEMKARFGVFLATALEHTPVADRLVLDTGDGAALCFLGDPEDALFAANSLRSAVLGAPGPEGLQLRLGINVGPVRVVKDINGQPNVLGDAINVAQRVMTFAAPNQILVSRSYYEMVSRLSPEYGQLFHYIGLHRDKHVREHEVYEVQLAPGRPGGTGDVPPARGVVNRFERGDGPADTVRPRPPRAADRRARPGNRSGGEAGRAESGRARGRRANALRGAGRERLGAQPGGVSRRPGGPGRWRAGRGHAVLRDGRASGRVAGAARTCRRDRA